MRTRQFCLMAIALIPHSLFAALEGSIEGQSPEYKVIITDDKNFSAAQLIITRANPNEDSYDQPVSSTSFKHECVGSRTEIRCSKTGKTILAGVIYRRTADETPGCFGEMAAYRYTCVQGCSKHVPRYLRINFYEC